LLKRRSACVADISEEKLEAAKRDVVAASAEMLTLRCDLGESAAIGKMSRLEEKPGPVDLPRAMSFSNDHSALGAHHVTSRLERALHTD
jgi:hypothetical protein